MKRLLLIIPVVVSLLLISCNTDNDSEFTGGGTVAVKVTVVDYCPAPGQFINELPAASSTDTYAAVLAAANKSIAEGRPVSLGAFGGYIVMKTDAPISGRFRVLGNAIPNGSEPGIVAISVDGQKWYNLRGEKYSEGKLSTVVYYRPEDGASDDRYIKYQCDGVEAYLHRLPAYHTQPYYPLWVSESSLTYTAMMLPNNSTLEGLEYKFTPLEGYADSYPNNSEMSILDSSNAVDEDGNNVNIGKFCYIRVTSAILRENGALGESSTEVAGVELVK